jgi:protein-S-isoprenylcysteine O-methyltransferase Ste14
MLRTILRGAAITGGFAAIHSLLATDLIKGIARRLVGERAFDGLYRGGFNLVALCHFFLLLRAFGKLPDRTLYHVRGLWSLPFRIVQGFAIYVAFDANIRTGMGRMTAIGSFRQWLGGGPVDPQNPAQGPQLTDKLPYHTAGAFQISRHPNNLVPVLLWWANPKMTVRFLVFTGVATLYLYLGSFHEEMRLSAAYGERYDRYRQGIPFFFPTLGRARPRSEP